MPVKKFERKMKSFFVLLPLRVMAALLVALILFGLFWGGAQPAAVGLFQPPIDKLAHLVVYALLTLGVWLAAGGRPVLSFVLPAWIGLMDEFHQSGLPGRTMDLWDWGMDVLAAGLMVGLLLSLATRNVRRPLATDTH